MIGWTLMTQSFLLELGMTPFRLEREEALVNAIPGLITLAIESVSSYIEGKQQQRINTMVEELRNDDNKIRNDLRQHRNELLMYGRYISNSLKGVINTINALHDRLILKEL